MEVKKLFLVCAIFLGLLPTCNATVEITAAVGPDWLKSKDTHVIISSFETDEILVNEIANEAQWKMGIGYSIFESNLEHNNFLNQLLLELNLYHIHSTLKGDVWQFNRAEFNNYNFQAPFTSTRLMVDLKPLLFTYHKFSPYIIMGIGMTSNTIKYNETATGVGVDPNSALSLGKERQDKFAYEAGLGFRTEITRRLSASFEYLYAFLGNDNSPSDESGIVRMAQGPTFRITSQSGLFGLTWIF